MDIEREVVQTRENVTTCGHSCAHHAKLMDTALWSELPEDLQELVFARLPWPQIYRVRILSKGWNQKLISGVKDSQLKRACARAQPKLFGLLTYGGDPGSVTVNMFDIESNRWHTFETSLGDPKSGKIIFIQGVSSSSGGLVCLLTEVPSKSKKTSWLVFVGNPLTGVWKQLPPLAGIVQQKIMVQLIMDHETKHDRVIVVGYCKDPKVGNLVNVYHSETRQWTKAAGSSSGEVVYGYFYSFKSDGFKRTPYSYNFADGLVHKTDTETDITGEYAHLSVLLKDHLFRRKDVEEPTTGLQTHCIEEYQAVHCGASWTLLKEYPLNRLRSNPHIQPNVGIWFTDIYACEDFLLLFVYNDLGEENCSDFAFIYEFSGEEWREIPTILGGDVCMQMCALHFDSVP